jgi:hypothetical protein
LHTILVSPRLHRLADEFAAIAHRDRDRRNTGGSNLSLLSRKRPENPASTGSRRPISRPSAGIFSRGGCFRPKAISSQSAVPKSL